MSVKPLESWWYVSCPLSVSTAVAQIILKSGKHKLSNLFSLFKTVLITGDIYIKSCYLSISTRTANNNNDDDNNNNNNPKKLKEQESPLGFWSCVNLQMDIWGWIMLTLLIKVHSSWDLLDLWLRQVSCSLQPQAWASTFLPASGCLGLAEQLLRQTEGVWIRCSRSHLFTRHHTTLL